MGSSAYLPWLLLLCQLSVTHGYFSSSFFIPAPTTTELAISTDLSTCGYLNGDPEEIRTANSGYDCRVDTRNGLWGFCPTTVISAEDCGLAGSCVDKHDCSDGCGLTDSEDLTTLTCNSKSYCSLALLTFGADQTYSYIACGAKAVTDHYYITPTVDVTATSETSELSTSSDSSEPRTTSSNLSKVSTTSVNTEGTHTSTGSVEDTVKGTIVVPSQPSAEESSSSSGNSTNTGAIVGGVIGGLVLVCGTAIAAIYLLRRDRGVGFDSKSREENTPQGARRIWSFREAKQPREMGGWGPQELPDNTNNGLYGRENAVELAS